MGCLPPLNLSCTAVARSDDLQRRTFFPAWRVVRWVKCPVFGQETDRSMRRFFLGCRGRLKLPVEQGQPHRRPPVEEAIFRADGSTV